MANFNKVLLIGRLTRDPQLSYLPSQTAVVDFGLAVNRNWTGRDGEKKEETCFVDCRAFGRLAENINKYLTKGRLLFVEGRLTFDTWTAQDGTKRSRHRVTVENFQFLPAGGPASGDASHDRSASQLQPAIEQGARESSAPKPDQQENPDDIPF